MCIFNFVVLEFIRDWLVGGAGHVCDPLCEYILIVLLNKVTHSNDLSLPQQKLSIVDVQESLRVTKIVSSHVLKCHF